MIVLIVYLQRGRQSTPGIGSDVADATETALPKLTFAAAWLHERLFDVPAVQVAL
jgi:hypothetical protein